MVIGVTDTLGSEDKFQLYLDWLKKGLSSVEYVRLSYKADNLMKVESCDALVLTGGHDVAPELYGGSSDHPTIVDVDRNRDSFERKALDVMLRLDRPVLGICRGLQIASVHFGGTLIADIEEAGYGNHRGTSDTGYRHPVSLQPESMLYAITQKTEGSVSSSHHQAVKDVGNGLVAVARSHDGIIEALELTEKQSHSFFLLVQWHPERMSDTENPLSGGILKAFCSSIQLQGVHNT